MKELDFSVMELIECGKGEDSDSGISSGCWWAIGGMVVSCFSAVAIGSLAGLALWAAGQVTAIGGLVASCS